MSTSSSPDFGPSEFGLPYQPPPLQPAPQSVPAGQLADGSGFLAADQAPGAAPSSYAGEPKSARSWILPALLILFLLIGAGAYFSLNSFSTVEVKVGDCMGVVDRTTLKKVDCKAAGAVYKVVAIIENQKRPTPQLNPCANHQGASTSYWQGGTNGTGRLFCLMPQ